MWAFLTSPVTSWKREQARKQLGTCKWDCSKKAGVLEKKEERLIKQIAGIQKGKDAKLKKEHVLKLVNQISGCRRRAESLRRSENMMGMVLETFDTVDVSKNMAQCLGVLNSEMKQNGEIGSIMAQFKTSLLNMELDEATIQKQLSSELDPDQREVTLAEQSEILAELGISYEDESPPAQQKPIASKEEAKESYKDKSLPASAPKEQSLPTNTQILDTLLQLPSVPTSVPTMKDKGETPPLSPELEDQTLRRRFNALNTLSVLRKGV